MKRIGIPLFLLLLSMANLKAQDRIVNLEGGYFGNTITHPGIVLGLEYVVPHTTAAHFISRANAGFYVHPRYHTGIFLDAGFGFRRHYRSGIFLEESIGAGILEPYLNSDGVYEVADNGEVTEVSRFAPIDFMPSVTLGIGYDITKAKEQQTLVWLRPKVFWQLPHKLSSTYNLCLQVGLSYRIR